MRIVVKMGTSSLTDADGLIDSGAVAKVAAEVAHLRARGVEFGRAGSMDRLRSEGISKKMGSACSP